MNHSEFRNIYLGVAVEAFAQHPCIPLNVETREAFETWVKAEMAKVLRDANAFADRKVAEGNR